MAKWVPFPSWQAAALRRVPLLITVHPGSQHVLRVKNLFRNLLILLRQNTLLLHGQLRHITQQLQPCHRLPLISKPFLRCKSVSRLTKTSLAMIRYSVVSSA